MPREQEASSTYTFDVLVVGGGIAGLTAAAYLTQAGLKVLLCEKNGKTGGLVNSFDRNGFIFDGGIRAMENSGIIRPMLRQLGIELDFLPSAVSIGIGRDVVRIVSKDSLAEYQGLLNRQFPENKRDIADIIQQIRKTTDDMNVLYGIDNPLFLDLKGNPGYVFRTVLPWLLKYMLTMPRLSRLRGPVDKYLSGFTRNQALVDLIAQHFFQNTPAFFALSYFRLYLDYRYPRGGTGALTQAMAQFVLTRGGNIATETPIVRVEPGRNIATDSRGNTYQYKKLVWAADMKTLYRILSLDSHMHPQAVRKIQAKQQALSGKIGGDSVLTLYVTVNLNKEYFERIGGAHFFYSASTTGLSQCPLTKLRTGDKGEFSSDRALVLTWLKRYLELTTYEISCPVLRDASLAPEGKTGLIISTLFDYSLTKHIRSKGWYDEFKQVVANQIIETLNATIYQELKASIIDHFTSTPLTLERLSGNSEGAITGWSFTNDVIPAVSKLPKVASSVLTPIPDVYQAGQWTFSPSGLPISILTGKLAADRIIKELK